MKRGNASFIDNFKEFKITDSGLYILHINAPGVGEKIIKWYGALRPIDLDTF